MPNLSTPPVRHNTPADLPHRWAAPRRVSAPAPSDAGHCITHHRTAPVGSAVLCGTWPLPSGHPPQVSPAPRPQHPTSRSPAPHSFSHLTLSDTSPLSASGARVASTPRRPTPSPGRRTPSWPGHALARRGSCGGPVTPPPVPARHGGPRRCPRRTAVR